MDDVKSTIDSHGISPSSEISDQNSVSDLGIVLSLDDNESICYKENFSTIRKLLVGSSDFSLAVSPEGYTIIKIGNIPFVIDDIAAHDPDITIKIGGHQYYELNWLKQNHEKSLPTYEEWQKAKEICGGVDTLISIINGAGNGFISKNAQTKTTRTYASGFSFHPFQGDDIYGQYICKWFSNNNTKFAPVNGENFVSCKRVYRGDISLLSFHPISETDILGYLAKDGILDLCYTTDQYVKSLNDQIYEAYLKHKPFKDFYTNLTIESKELQEELMSNLFLVVLSQYDPSEIHITDVIEYAKKYFAGFNLPKNSIEAFFEDMLTPQDFLEKFSNILGLNNKIFSLLKERISDLQDEYPEYNLNDLCFEENITTDKDFYSRKNRSLLSEKKPLSLQKKQLSFERAQKSFPFIGYKLSHSYNSVDISRFVDDSNKSIFPYIQFFLKNNFNVLLSLKELKYLDIRFMQIYTLIIPKIINLSKNMPIVNNENEFLIDKYSVGKILLPTDTLPDPAYLPSQHDIIQFYDMLEKENNDLWEFLINNISLLSYNAFSEPHNVFSLNEIYIPCADGGIIISQYEGIKKVSDKPDNPHLLVALIKNIVPSEKKSHKSIGIRNSIQSLRADKKSIKRYQRSKRKDIKNQQKEILDVLRQRNTQKKSIRFNQKLAERYSKYIESINLENLPFTSAQQIIINLEVYQNTSHKWGKEHIDILIRAGYTDVIFEHFALFDEDVVYNCFRSFNSVWEKVLPHIKKFTQDNQRGIISSSFAVIGSKVANFLDYFPDKILDSDMIWTIIKDPQQYKNIERSKYRHVFDGVYLDGSNQDNIGILKEYPIDVLIKILPFLDLNDLGYDFIAILTKDDTCIPIIMSRFSELKYKDTIKHTLPTILKNIQEYYKDDNVVAKTFRETKDISLLVSIVVSIVDSHQLHDLDQTFFLDLLKRITGSKQTIGITKERLDTFQGPLSMEIVDALTEQGYISLVLDNLDMFVSLPDNYFSEIMAQKLIEIKGIWALSYVIKYFHNLSADIALQIHNTTTIEKYKLLHENRASFTSFPVSIFSKEDAQNCLDTYGLEKFSKCAQYFDEMPRTGLQYLYAQLYTESDRETIVTYIDFFIDFIPSRLYRRLQRHEYIKIEDSMVSDLTQQKQVRKYIAPQEFQAVATITPNLDLPSEGRYMDMSVLTQTKGGLSRDIFIDDIVEEYDPFCMPYDYFYHDEDKQISLGDKTVYVIKRTRENGSSFGFDTIYLVDLTDFKKVYIKKIADSLSTQKYVTIKNARVEGENIVIDLSTGQYKEAYQPLVDMRNDIKDIVEKKLEEDYITSFSVVQNQIITEIFLGAIKEDSNFDSTMTQRLHNLLKHGGGNTDYLLQKVFDDKEYCSQHPDIVFRIFNLCISLKIYFSQEQSGKLLDILLHNIDWKKYPECPILSADISALFSRSSGETKNKLIDKLIKVYGSNLLQFAEKFGNTDEIIDRCIQTGIMPKGFSLLVYQSKNSQGVKYLIEKNHEDFYQYIIPDVRIHNLDIPFQNILVFYGSCIKKYALEELVKPSLFLQLLDKDTQLVKTMSEHYIFISSNETSPGNTTQILHYLHKTGLLKNIQIALVNPAIIKDIVTFSATYDVSNEYLQKLTEGMMDCLRDQSSKYTDDKMLLMDALRFLITLVPATFKHLQIYANAQKYDIKEFVNTVYVPFT